MLSHGYTTSVLHDTSFQKSSFGTWQRPKDWSLATWTSQECTRKPDLGRGERITHCSRYMCLTRCSCLGQLSEQTIWLRAYIVKCQVQVCIQAKTTHLVSPGILMQLWHHLLSLWIYLYQQYLSTYSHTHPHVPEPLIYCILFHAHRWFVLRFLLLPLQRNQKNVLINHPPWYNT